MDINSVYINAFLLGYRKGKTIGDSGASALDAIVERSITEVSSGATRVGTYAFRGCSQLVNANFPNATSVDSNAFQNCSRLVSARFPKVTIIDASAFNSCGELKTLDFPNATSVGKYAFNYCQQLTNVVFPSVTTILSNAFQDCYKLASADFPKATSIGGSAFFGCHTLTALVLRSTSLCALSSTDAFSNCYHIAGTVHNTYNPNGDKNGYIYVPASLVASYQTATNWSNFASQFRALEDYTVDGTITGKLDPNKI